jgi:hypothetical protein
LSENLGKTETVLMQYKLERSANRMTLEISSNKELGPISIRLGPFNQQPRATSVLINGRSPDNATVQYSGDSWWVEFSAKVGPARVIRRN